MKFSEPKHPILENIGITSFDYVIKSANEVHQQELESALLLLPIEYLLEFMNLLCDAIDQKKSVERVSVILNALQRICSKFPSQSNPTRDPPNIRFGDLSNLDFLYCSGPVLVQDFSIFLVRPVLGRGSLSSIKLSLSVDLNLIRLFLPQLTSSRKYASVLQRAEKCSMAALNEIKSVADFNFAILSLLQGWFLQYFMCCI